MDVDRTLAERFMVLHDGLRTAFGTGRGEWVKRPPTVEDFEAHLNGRGPGIGIAPLRPDNTVAFAVIDLDEPDFKAAREMQQYIPGRSWIERSRSGNAHVLVYFSSPCPAWLAMGVLREATLAAGKRGVEVFPKNWDFERVKYGNYINLSYHGDSRPILSNRVVSQPLAVEAFLDEAEATRNDPKDWQRRAALMQIAPPSDRSRSAEFGTQKNLHVCAERIISGEAGIITEGHQNAALFMLAKCLTNWEQVDHDEALDLLLTTARDLFDPIPAASEIRRILSNVERARYTSTGCDDVLLLQYSDPSCPIAHPNTTGLR